jgi:hypothetical protein
MAPVSTTQRTIVESSLHKGIVVRVIATMSSVLGLLTTTGAFMLWAANGLPYSDATADLLKGQHERAVQLGLVMLLGMAITVAGSAYLWRNRHRGKR